MRVAANLLTRQENTATNVLYVFNNVPLDKLLQFHCKNVKYQFISKMHSLRYIFPEKLRFTVLQPAAMTSWGCHGPVLCFQFMTIYHLPERPTLP